MNYQLWELVSKVEHDGTIYIINERSESMLCELLVMLIKG